MSLIRHCLLATAVATLPAIAFAQAKPEAAKPEATKPAAKADAAKPAAKGICDKVKLSTTAGPIVLALDRAKAPLSVENFTQYVQSGHYNGTVFHRVIGNFMIQGGGFGQDLKQKSTREAIKNEAANGLKNDTYTIAMARTGVRDSATAQFFINVKNNDMLNYRDETPSGWGYAVFGKVVEGQATVDKIKATPTGPGGSFPTDVPTTAVVIEKAECV